MSLGNFGGYEDAMWTGRSFLYHSRLSAALNLHLLNPGEVIDAAVRAFEAGDAPRCSPFSAAHLPHVISPTGITHQTPPPPGCDRKGVATRAALCR